MKTWILGMLVLVLTGCSRRPASTGQPLQATGEQSQPVAQLADFGPAPEFSNEVWLNTSAPLRLADLRGKVVAVDMWTFG